MSWPIVILGNPGTGKTYGAFNIDYDEFNVHIQGLPPEKTFYINPIGKPLPKLKGYNEVVVNEKGQAIGNLVNAADSVAVYQWMIYASTLPHIENIVVDDFQQTMADDFLSRKDEKGYDKFGQIGYNAANILLISSKLRANICVFILAHTEEFIGEDGIIRIKFKTIGKMLDEKFSPEGMFTTILYAEVEWDDKNDHPVMYYRTVKKNKYDPVRAELGMFANDAGKPLHRIPNDFAVIKDMMRKHYSKA